MKRSPFSEAYASVLHDFGLSDFPRSQLFLLDYGKKEYIYREQDAVGYLLLLLHGRAKISTITRDGRTLLHSFTKAGGVIGETEMLTRDTGARLFVQAVTDVRCIGIPLPQAEKRLRENLAFMNRLAEILATKLVSSNLNDAHAILYPLENRLCSYIEMTSVSGAFEDSLTQTAELLGTSYRHLHRTLEKLCREGTLQKEGRRFLILDAQALHRQGGDFFSFR